MNEPQTAETREVMLTPKEYAYERGEHVESVRRRIRDGRQPGAVRVGGQWRIVTTTRAAHHS